MIFQPRAYPFVARALAVIFCLSIGTAARAAAADHVVYVDCDRGNDANSGLTQEAAKRTVLSALHSAPDGGSRSLVVSGNCTNRRSDLAPSTNLIKSHKCSIDQQRSTATFKIRFALPPDFFTLDSLGLPATAFQGFVDAAAAPTGVGDFYSAAGGETDGSTMTLLRGGEIHVDGDLRVRGIVPFWDEPGSGGWGPVLDAVPYKLVDSTVSFDVPLSMLKDAGDGNVWYLLEGYTYGAWDGVTFAGSCRPSPQRPVRPTR